MLVPHKLIHWRTHWHEGLQICHSSIRTGSTLQESHDCMHTHHPEDKTRLSHGVQHVTIRSLLFRLVDQSVTIHCYKLPVAHLRRKSRDCGRFQLAVLQFLASRLSVRSKANDSLVKYLRSEHTSEQIQQNLDPQLLRNFLLLSTIGFRTPKIFQ